MRGKNSDSWTAWNTVWSSNNFDPNDKLSKSGDTASELYNDGWFRSNGQTGWYSQTYGGGIWMNDESWVRVYGSKGFLTDWHQFHSDGNIWTSSYGWLHDKFAPKNDALRQFSANQSHYDQGGNIPGQKRLCTRTDGSQFWLYESNSTNCNCNCNCNCI